MYDSLGYALKKIHIYRVLMFKSHTMGLIIYHVDPKYSVGEINDSKQK